MDRGKQDVGCEPEFVGCEDDPPLQQQRAEHTEKQAQTQTREQTLKVHMLQARV